MFRTNRFFKVLFSLTAFFSISFQGMVVKATDIVATDDVISGASVFVFRDSRKKPQESAGGSIGVGGARKRTYREKVNAQIAANRKKKADAAKARQAAVAKARERRHRRSVQPVAAVGHQRGARPARHASQQHGRIESIDPARAGLGQRIVDRHAPASSVCNCCWARAAISASITSSRSPSITAPSRYSVSPMRWSVSRPCGKL